MRKENTEKRGWQRRRDKQESRVEREIERLSAIQRKGACGSDLQCDTGKAVVVVIVSIVKLLLGAKAKAAAANGAKRGLLAPTLHE